MSGPSTIGHSLNNLNAEDILRLQGDGRLTLDQENRLTVISGSTQRDNKVVRFFKGIGNPEYRAADQMKATANNVEVTKKIIEKTLEAFNPDKPGLSADEKSVNGLTQQILKRSLDKGEPLTPKLIQRAYAFAREIQLQSPEIMRKIAADCKVQTPQGEVPLMELMAANGKSADENLKTIQDTITRQITNMLFTPDDAENLSVDPDTISRVKAEFMNGTMPLSAALEHMGKAAGNILRFLTNATQKQMDNGLPQDQALANAQATIGGIEGKSLAVVKTPGVRYLSDIHAGVSLKAADLSASLQDVNARCKADCAATLRPGLARLAALPNPPADSVEKLLKLAETSPSAALKLLNRLADEGEAMAKKDADLAAHQKRFNALQTIIAQAGKDRLLTDNKIPGRPMPEGQDGMRLAGLPLHNADMRQWAQELHNRYPGKFIIDGDTLSTSCGSQELMPLMLGKHIMHEGEYTTMTGWVIKTLESTASEEEKALLPQNANDLELEMLLETRHGMNLRQETRINALVDAMLEFDGHD